nr:hypothetical protein Iba_chr04dCG8710 [Ipomoea batatas]
MDGQFPSSKQTVLCGIFLNCLPQNGAKDFPLHLLKHPLYCNPFPHSSFSGGSVSNKCRPDNFWIKRGYKKEGISDAVDGSKRLEANIQKDNLVSTRFAEYNMNGIGQKNIRMNC